MKHLPLTHILKVTIEPRNHEDFCVDNAEGAGALGFFSASFSWVSLPSISPLCCCFTVAYTLAG